MEAANESFASFYEETSQAIYRFAFVVAGDGGEDLASEAYARALVRWREVSGYARPDAWVRRVLLNLVASRERRNRVQRLFLAARARQEEAGTEEPSEDRILLRGALAALTPRQRAAVVLRYAEDLSLSEVALALGCSVSAVNAHLRRALPKLRASLGDLGVDVGDRDDNGDEGVRRDPPPPGHHLGSPLP